LPMTPMRCISFCWIIGPGLSRNNIDKQDYIFL